MEAEGQVFQELEGKPPARLAPNMEDRKDTHPNPQNKEVEVVQVSQDKEALEAPVYEEVVEEEVSLQGMHNQDRLDQFSYMLPLLIHPVI